MENLYGIDARHKEYRKYAFVGDFILSVCEDKYYAGCLKIVATFANNGIGSVESFREKITEILELFIYNSKSADEAFEDVVILLNRFVLEAIDKCPQDSCKEVYGFLRGLGLLEEEVEKKVSEVTELALANINETDWSKQIAISSWMYESGDEDQKRKIINAIYEGDKKFGLSSIEDFRADFLNRGYDLLDRYAKKFGLPAPKLDDLYFRFLNAAHEMIEKDFDLVIGVLNGGSTIAQMMEMLGADNVRYLRWTKTEPEVEPFWRDDVGRVKGKIEKPKRVLICEDDILDGVTLRRLEEFLREMGVEEVEVMLMFDDNDCELDFYKKIYISGDFPIRRAWDRLTEFLESGEKAMEIDPVIEEVRNGLNLD